MGVELTQNKRQGVLNEFRHGDSVNILVINNMQKVAELIAGSVDKIDATSCKMICIKVSDKHSHNDCYGNVDGQET